MKKFIYGIVTLIILVVVLYVLSLGKEASLEENLSTVSKEYLNASYVISGETITLVNGVGTIGSTTVNYFGNEVKMDIDGNDVEDIGFLITKKDSAQNTAFYFTGALDTKDGYLGTHAIFIGTNIAPQTTVKGNGRIVIVNYADRKPGEGFEVQPSVGKSLWLLLDPATREWGEVVQNFEGEADPSKLSLMTKTWIWTGAKYGEDALLLPKDPSKFTLTFEKDGRFSATTDCNGIGGTYIAKDGNIQFTDMISTLMFCEDSQEAMFRKMLSDAQGYIFTSKGELVFGLKVNGTAVFK